jgi:hypothetical protein
MSIETIFARVSCTDIGISVRWYENRSQHSHTWATDSDDPIEVGGCDDA